MGVGVIGSYTEEQIVFYKAGMIPYAENESIGLMHGEPNSIAYVQAGGVTYYVAHNFWYDGPNIILNPVLSERRPLLVHRLFVMSWGDNNTWDIEEFATPEDEQWWKDKIASGEVPT